MINMSNFECFNIFYVPHSNTFTLCQSNEYCVTTNWLYILNGFFVTEKLKLRQFEFCDFEITQLLSIQFIIKEISNYIIINNAIILKTNLVEMKCGYDV